MQFESTQTVTIAGVPTFVRAVGQGPIVVVLHGGPGFDHAYLDSPLRSLANRRMLIFYDQPGCGRSPTGEPVNAKLIFRHFAELVREVAIDAPIGLLAHSWGCLVALAAVQIAPGIRFDHGLLVNPVPITRAGYDTASGNLFARFPPQVQQRYADLAARGANKEIVDLLLPYYLARPIKPADVGLNFTVTTFASVTASLGDFDFRAQLPALRNCSALTTDKDITTNDLVADLLATVAHHVEIKNAGHFPAHEASENFQSILRSTFR
jgi:proline iminopeptidase